MKLGAVGKEAKRERTNPKKASYNDQISKEKKVSTKSKASHKSSATGNPPQLCLISTTALQKTAQKSYTPKKRLRKTVASRRTTKTTLP